MNMGPIEITAETPKVKNVVFLCSVHTSSASTLLLKCKQTDHITAGSIVLQSTVTVKGLHIHTFPYINTLTGSRFEVARSSRSYGSCLI
jgi:hypothetical protein